MEITIPYMSLRDDAYDIRINYDVKIKVRSSDNKLQLHNRVSPNLMAHITLDRNANNVVVIANQSHFHRNGRNTLGEINREITTNSRQKNTEYRHSKKVGTIVHDSITTNRIQIKDNVI